MGAADGAVDTGVIAVDHDDSSSQAIPDWMATWSCAPRECLREITAVPFSRPTVWPGR